MLAIKWLNPDDERKEEKLQALQDLGYEPLADSEVVRAPEFRVGVDSSGLFLGSRCKRHGVPQRFRRLRDRRAGTLQDTAAEELSERFECWFEVTWRTRYLVKYRHKEGKVSLEACAL